MIDMLTVLGYVVGLAGLALGLSARAERKELEQTADDLERKIKEHQDGQP